MSYSGGWRARKSLIVKHLRRLYFILFFIITKAKKIPRADRGGLFHYYAICFSRVNNLDNIFLSLYLSGDTSAPSK